METEPQRIPPTQRAGLWITEGIFIALITASAYFWALRYEEGWYEHFHIPSEFISLSLANVLSVSGPLNLIAAFMLVPILIMALIWNPTSRFLYRFSHEHPTATFFLSPSIPIIILIYYTVQIRESSPQLFWVTIIFVALLYTFFFIRPHVTKQWDGRYWDKFNESVRPRQTREPTGFYFSPNILNAIIIFAILGWVWLGTYSAYHIGKETASKKKVFSVISNYLGVPEVVLLRTYGDYLITVPFDRSTKEVEKNFYILMLSMIDPIVKTTEG